MTENQNGGPQNFAGTSDMTKNFEFRPCGKNQTSNSVSGPSGRSKSPSAIIERFTNFARGKYRNSLNEKMMSTSIDDRPRRVSCFSGGSKCVISHENLCENKIH